MLPLCSHRSGPGLALALTRSNQIFEDAGQDNASLSSVILGIVQVVVTAIACLLIDKTGRRALLMFAGIGMTGACLLLGVYLLLSCR